MQIDFGPYYDYLANVEPWWLVLAGMFAGACLAALVARRLLRRHRGDAFEAGLQASAAQHAEQLNERDLRLEPVDFLGE